MTVLPGATTAPPGALAAVVAAAAAALAVAPGRESPLRSPRAAGTLAAPPVPTAAELGSSKGPIPAASWWRWWPAGGTCGVVMLAGLAAGVTGAIAAAVVALSWLHRRARRGADEHAARRSAAWSEVLRSVETALRAGLSPAEALGNAFSEPGAKPLADLAVRVRVMAAVSDSPAGPLEREGDPGALLAAAWRLNGHTGARLVPAVAQIRRGLEEEAAAQRELDQAVAAARTSARLLALLAPAGLVLGAGLGVDSLRILIHTGIGHLCLLGGVVAECSGLLLADRLADRARRSASPR